QVHRLVLMAFVGPPREGEECRHLNGIPHDNRPINLAWGSARENWNDKRLHGTDTKGQRHPRSVLNDAAVSEIRGIPLPWPRGTLFRLARKFACRPGTVAFARDHKTWV